MACQSLEEGFTGGEPAEMEGLRPGFFVEVGDEVVVAVMENDQEIGTAMD